ASPASGFSVQNGQIIAPDGGVFVARGINVYDSAQGSVSTNAAGAPLTTLFPGINFIRLDTYQYSDPSFFQTFVEQMSALHVVVEIEHHEGAGGGVAPLTGQDLTDESSWFATLAAAFKDDPYVWFGTLNEPSGPGSDLTAEQVSNYQAIRGAGSNAIVMMEVLGDYSTGSLTVGAGHGLVASSYAGMSNIVWDFHYYNWLSGYSADVGTNANLLASYIAQSQTIASADGTVPVLIGEYGISTDGTNVDPGGDATCVAVQQSGAGSAAWNWDSYAPSDNLTDGNNDLTSYGQEVASYVNGP
ncbi:MAG TPA: cellulase family glycosylhydrolase, partial [Polyangiaceae bacterium]